MWRPCWVAVFPALGWATGEVAPALAAVQIRRAGTELRPRYWEEKDCTSCRSKTVQGANSLPGAVEGV